MATVQVNLNRSRLTAELYFCLTLQAPLMIRVFPESALAQLEFDKIKQLLHDHCQSAYAKEKASQLRVHTRKEFIDRELRQSHEFALILSTGQYFPNDTVFNIKSELKLLSIPGAVLSSPHFQQIRRLAETEIGRAHV